MKTSLTARHCQQQRCADWETRVQVLAAFGQVECEGLQWGKAQKFALIVLGFIGTLYSNVTSLKVRAVLALIMCGSLRASGKGTRDSNVTLLMVSALLLWLSSVGQRSPF